MLLFMLLFIINTFALQILGQWYWKEARRSSRSELPLLCDRRSNFQDSADRCFHALQLIYPGGVQKGTLGLVGDKCKQIPHPAKAQGVASDRKEAQNNIKEQILEQVRNRKCLTFLICCLHWLRLLLLMKQHQALHGPCTGDTWCSMSPFLHFILHQTCILFFFFCRIALEQIEISRRVKFRIQGFVSSQRSSAVRNSSRGSRGLFWSGAHL